ncbi:GNAT family N-acetyltransferase [uncultured Amnibacterium sp.]|uniref:GNAT family N-acetyltransferase n=1 Tax=uncultured Amnibacterium sp. TaxID=1631851 RepID=UPI0035CC9D0E
MTEPVKSRTDVRDRTFSYVAPGDERARFLFHDLEREYDSRYADLLAEPATTELSRYPDSHFLPPDGAFLLVEELGVVVAGGAFMRYDEQTAEFKRIWTHPEHRRRGLSRVVLAELEAEATRRGYRRVFLTTGPRQPEAQALYAASGYTVLPLLPIADGFHVHPFEKDLPLATERRAS